MDSEISKLAESVISLASQKGLKVTSAESCTGGGIAHALTSVSGSSAAFDGSVVAYANEIKSEVLGVPDDVLKDHGAVSEPVARIMATSIRDLMSADYSVSVTGIAGPTGGLKDKPIGLVYVGIATPDNVEVRAFRFGAIGRDAVRNETIKASLHMLAEALRKP